MIIGISGTSQSHKSEVSKFISHKYGFQHIDGDKILQQILEQEQIKKELQKDNWRKNKFLLLKIKNQLDLRLLSIIEEIDSSKNIIIDYSLLEDSFIFEKCDALIKVSSNIKTKLENNLDILKNSRVSSLSNDSRYHLKINTSFEWQEKLSQYIEYNIFGNKKISVIVPIYNTSKYLIRCVDSIRNQTYRNLEILLIDDGSTDYSLEMCRLLSEKDDRIKVIHQNNIGLAETRNKGIDIASGEYICFIDSDDYIENGMIETLLKNAERTNSDVSGVRAYIHLRNGRVEGFSNGKREIISTRGTREAVSSYSNGIISIAAWDKLYKKESLEGIRFDKNVFKEDSDFILKLCLAGRNFVCDTKEYYHYVKRTEDSITSKFSDNIFQLGEWGHQAYYKILSLGEEYRDDAEKCLFNSLSHILKTYMRDLKNNNVKNTEYTDKIQIITNDLINLLLQAKNVKKFDDLDNVLEVINQLLEQKVIAKEKMPIIDVKCIGILWNTLNNNLMQEAIDLIEDYSKINECISIDLQDKYKDFIYDIYQFNDEFEGIPYFKSCGLIDRYDSNTIVILNLVVRVSNYVYYNGMKGYLFKEISELKNLIRKSFKNKIENYGYDTIFHLTVNEDEYQYTDEICKKYIREYRGK